MADLETRVQVMRAIGAMEQEFPAAWSGPSMWADVVEQVADLICELQIHLSPVQLAVLMSVGAMAHRQCKAERSADKKGARA